MTVLYGKTVAESYLPELERLMDVCVAHKPMELRENDKEMDVLLKPLGYLTHRIGLGAQQLAHLL